MKLLIYILRKQISPPPSNIKYTIPFQKYGNNSGSDSRIIKTQHRAAWILSKLLICKKDLIAKKMGYIPHFDSCKMQLNQRTALQPTPFQFPDQGLG